MMSEMRSRSVLNRATYTGDFEVGSRMRVQVQLFTRCREQLLPSLKKESTLGTDTKAVITDRVYKNKFSDYANGDANANANVNVNVNANANADSNDNKGLPEDERIPSYLYGKQRIPFTQEDKNRLDYASGEKHFQLLAFTDKKLIPRSHFMGPVMVCVAQAGNQGSAMTLSTFIHGCFEKNRVAIARLVSRKNAAPKLVVLEPRIKASGECFVVNELPFYEDIRNYPFASFAFNKKFQPTAQQIEAAKNLVNSLNLMEEDDNEGEKELLRPQEMFNPILQRFYENLQCRALDPNAPIQPLSPTIIKYLEPPEEVFRKAEPALKEFAEKFPVTVIRCVISCATFSKKEAKKERKHWSELNDEINDLLQGLSLKKEEVKVKEEIDEDMNIHFNQMLEINAITKIGTKSPIHDFDQLLKKRSSPDHFQK
ncbi:ATP-dependent DNA helicase, partial [Reticulomyxa filosa]